MADPSVAAMTDAQWLFEYEGLRAKEKEDWDRTVAVFKAATRVGRRLLRDALIDIFGLGLLAPPAAASVTAGTSGGAGVGASGAPAAAGMDTGTAAGAPARAAGAPAAGPANDDDGGVDPDPPFIPGAFVLGNPRVVKMYLDEVEQAGAAVRADTVAEDAAFDRYSRDLYERLKRGEMPPGAGDAEPLENWREELALAGVALEESSEEAPPVPHAGAAPDAGDSDSDALDDLDLDLGLVLDDGGDDLTPETEVDPKPHPAHARRGARRG